MLECRVGLQGAPSRGPCLADGAREQRGSLVAEGQGTKLQPGGGILPCCHCCQWCRRVLGMEQEGDAACTGAAEPPVRWYPMPFGSHHATMGTRGSTQTGGPPPFPLPGHQWETSSSGLTICDSVIL